ncbi:alpha/beta fold hydrolase [Natranaerobius thermophilus]|uniref:Alpha/beta hydrolase fold n=1 Tax=Natranaerobius thermophilus (strain ATCC BAA-1301 / DSM 18059 / JW/NM-WN-LF) TaxID=457570 RepID=B2A2S3_NATTJ|nr:alpha/beta hydrolase [Natranaerobius thermophilus]ACB86291.1 alpha/beta hydrolase fold [Natranaerobius thermophilus JW/NM-WN-LF]
MVRINIDSVEIPRGETIYYRWREGSSSSYPLVLVHGNMTSSKHWDLLMENLTEKYQIYAIDLPGFGLSTYNKPINDIKDLSLVLRQFCDKLNLEKFYLVGWSTGGAVAMKLIADNPQYADKLALLAPISTRGYPIYKSDQEQQPLERVITRDEVAQEFDSIVKAFQRKDREVVRQIWNQLIYVNNQPSPEKYEEYLDDILTQRNLIDVYNALNKFNISEVSNGVDYGTGEARDIKLPTKILWGDLDQVVTREMIRETISDLGISATLVTNEHCGHNLMIDDLPWVVKELESFLQ